MSEDVPSIELKSVARTEDETILSLTVVISSGENRDTRVLLIPEKSYYDLKLKKGAITPVMFDKLEAEAKLCNAYRRGAGILGFGANSGKTLVRKLRQRGFDSETALSAVEKLRNDGYINEREDALHEAELCVRKLWGMRRINARLFEKGFAEDAVNAAREYLSDVNFPENCALFIVKKYVTFPTERKEADKAVAALMRYGYSSSDIREALRILHK